MDWAKPQYTSIFAFRGLIVIFEVWFSKIYQNSILQETPRSIWEHKTRG